MASVILARHTRVAAAWAGRCYGQSDPGLSREGRRDAKALAKKLAAKRIDLVIHSGLTRARLLAELIAALANAPLRVDRRWRERNFRAWEGRTWNAIWRETGSAMDGMLTQPRRYRPGGGETTAELARRALSAWKDLPHDRNVIVVTHGGPIATLRAHLAGRSLTALLKNRFAEGDTIRLQRTRRRRNRDTLAAS